MRSWTDPRAAREVEDEARKSIIRSVAGPVREDIVAWLKGSTIRVGFVEAESSQVVVGNPCFTVSVPGSSMRSQTDLLRHLFSERLGNPVMRKLADPLLAMVTDKRVLQSVIPGRENSKIIASAISCPEIRKALSDLVSASAGAIQHLTSKRKDARMVKAKAAFATCVSSLKRLGYEGQDLKDFMSDEVDAIEVAKVMNA
jgi:hypothetical protein